MTLGDVVALAFVVAVAAAIIFGRRKGRRQAAAAHAAAFASGRAAAAAEASAAATGGAVHLNLGPGSSSGLFGADYDGRQLEHVHNGAAIGAGVDYDHAAMRAGHDVQHVGSASYDRPAQLSAADVSAIVSATLAQLNAAGHDNDGPGYGAADHSAGHNYAAATSSDAEHSAVWVERPGAVQHPSRGRTVSLDDDGGAVGDGARPVRTDLPELRSVKW